MRLQYHPAVRREVAGAIRRYKAVSQKLADDFKAELQRVIAMDPKHDFQRAAGLLGYVLYKNGKNDEAGKVFAAVTQTSTISETLCHYAEFLAAQGDAAQARAWLQQVLNKKATLPLYLKRRERPWFRKAKSLMKNIPQGSKVGSQQATA